MKLTLRKKQAFLVVLALILVCSLSCAPLIESAGAFSQAVESKLVDITGQYDVTSLNEQNFNYDVVTKSETTDVSEITGEIGVIVDLGGSGLYDIYTQGDNFADFVLTSQAKNYVERLQNNQQDFISALDESGICYTYRTSYTTINNAVAINIDASDFENLKNVKGVVNVYRSETYAKPQDIVAVENNANVYTTGVYNSSDLDCQGSGVVVAILDTGLDYAHSAFSTMPSNVNNNIWTKEYIAEHLGLTDDDGSALMHSAQLGFTADDVYYSAKVPYAFDYADNDANVYSSYSSHGTHVAGIIAGQDDSKVVNDDGDTFIGVAPDAQLAIFKVFTDDVESDLLGGADTIDILDALNDCVALGVDVINMSLGSTGGFSDMESDDYVSQTYQRIEDAGISLVVAAGNEYSSGYGGSNGTNLASNPDSGTVASPSTYSAALSVASIAGQESPYFVGNQGTDSQSVAFITNSSDGNGNEIEFLDTLYEALGKDKTETITLDYVVIGGVGRQLNYTTSIKNKLRSGNCIALISRGDTTFAEKVETAMANGAVACIVYNNVSGSIRMSLGDVVDPIPTCSIGMDAGKLLVDAAGGAGGTGTITFSYENTAGPFMSDFSSWGPTPDLHLKPEITAYGGNILSAVDSGYAEYSGTSMACPNMSGMIAILRQYLKSQGLSGTELNARVNQLMMSTATMALNEEGNPYSPRKQGAGLGNIADALKTSCYITVGSSDKTKVEFFDDAQRTGVYKTTLTLHNTSSTAVSYTPVTYVMTETLASDGKTVAEKAYMLTDTDIVYKINGKVVNGDVTVPANGSVDVEITITLGDAGRQYIEESFENGMYVEGFFRFESSNNDIVSLGCPFLAFYGDWSDAQLFDYTVYEVAEDENDSSLEDSDKRKASAAATTPYGSYDTDYIIPLGAYVYTMDDDYVEIATSEEHASVSMFNYDYGPQYSINSLSMVYAGLLRGAKTMDVSIVNNETGEVVYQKTEYNLRKSYAGGGGNYGSPISLDINPYEWGWANNTSYTLTLTGYIDWDDGEVTSNTFSFSFTVDYEAPVISDYRIRFEQYTEDNETKYRIWMDVDVYDNNYAMALMPCYLKDNTLTSLTRYPIPVYSEKNDTTLVSFDITDYYEDYFLTGKMSLYVMDYAMNHTLYWCNTSAVDYPDELTFATDSSLTYLGEETDSATGVAIPTYSLTLQPNESYTPAVATITEDTYNYKLTWTSSSKNVLVQEGEIFAKSATQNAAVTVSADDAPLARIYVTVEGDALSEPRLYSLSFAAASASENNVENIDGGSLTLHNNMQTQLTVIFDPWYITDVDLTWSSSNEKVATVDKNGLVSTHKTGSATITVSAEGYSLMELSLRITVDDDYSITNYRLYEYYGSADVVIPEDRNVMYIDDECFQGDTRITSIVLPSTLQEIPADAFKGCTSLNYVYINGECASIGADAFSGCTSLETIEFGLLEEKVTKIERIGSTLIGPRAFYGCTSLAEVVNPTAMTTIKDQAFYGCTALKTIDLTALRSSGSYVFAASGLSSVTIGENTVLGSYMFTSCNSIKSVKIPTATVPSGCFENCSKLQQVTFDGCSVIGDAAFAGTALKTVTLPNNAFSLGMDAFASCSSLTTVELGAASKITDDALLIPFESSKRLAKINVAEDNPYYYSENGILYSKDKKTLIYLPVANGGTVLSSVENIGASAFGGSSINSVDLGSYTSVGSFAFASSNITSVTIPADWTEIPTGLFYGCSSLTTVVFEEGSKLKTIGNFAFYGCTKLSTIDLPDTVETLGYASFESCSKLTKLNLANVETIGAYALAKTGLQKIEAPNAHAIGSYAFGGNESLKEVVLGAVTTMAEGIFLIDSDSSLLGLATLETVVFGEGTTEIAAYTLAMDSRSDNLTRVVIPYTVTKIGSYAFLGRTLLQNLNGDIDLSNVTEIGDYAFAECESLTDLDLSKVQTVGTYAFYEAESLTSANLASATLIDNLAFANSGLTELTLGAAEVIGSYAFMNTAITSVQIPKSLNSATYEQTWEEYNDANDLETIYGKMTSTFGSGVFLGCTSLATITVEQGNDVYFVDESSVLYQKYGDGYVLLFYPVCSTATEYEVLDGTTRIGEAAFYGATNLTKVVFPASLKSIGTMAFYGVTTGTDNDSRLGVTFQFKSVEAPVLETIFVNYQSQYLSDSTLLTYLLGFPMTNDVASNAYLASTLYYANFGGFIVSIVEEDRLKTNMAHVYDAYGIAINEQVYNYESSDLGLNLIYPQNGVGYDTVIWKAFFAESGRQTTEYAADSKTLNAISKISGLCSADELRAAVAQISDTTAKLEYVNTYSSDVVSVARSAYNLVTDSEQLALITESAKLLGLEAAIREIKAELGSPVNVSELLISSQPTKYKYTEGDTFDSTGMVVTAVFEDGSRLAVTDYTLSVSGALTASDTEITVSYGGKSNKIYISVESTSNVVDPVNPDSPANNDSQNNAWFIVLWVALGVVIVAATVVAVVVIHKKHNSSK